ncbi:MAG TPA: hypothetical protein VMF87_34560, partial [Streptosporangiaceae bacterium]|nr:hypothetical protein [Streptosporangiaceae bacterium]
MTSNEASGRIPASSQQRPSGGGRPRVYLHVGEPKTGTTFLQHVLFGNRDRLDARGVVLPGYTRRDHSRASRDLRGAGRPDEDPADPWVGEWDVLTGQALCAREKAVISDEVLAACTAEEAGKAIRSLQSAEPHVIITARDFASLLAAEWQERIKVRGTEPWEAWLKEVVDLGSADVRRFPFSRFWNMHDTLAIVDMWAQHIPPDHVHVITVPWGQSEELWVRFASVLGIDPGGFDLSGARSNQSLGTLEVEFLRRMNEQLPPGVPDWFYTRNIKRILAHGILSERPGQKRLVLPPDVEDWAIGQSETLVAGLRDSKYHIVGDLSDLVSKPAATPYVDPASQSTAALLETAVHAAASMADTHYQQIFAPKRKPERLGLRKRLSKIEWDLLNGPATKRI